MTDSSMRDMTDHEFMMAAGPTEIAKKVGVNPDDPRDIERFFDEGLAELRNTAEEEREAAQSWLVEGTGSMIGQYLVNHHGLRWVMLTDEWGTRAGLTDDGGLVRLSPFDSVAKRVEDGESGWVARYIEFAIAALTQHGSAKPTIDIREEPAETESRWKKWVGKLTGRAR